MERSAISQGALRNGKQASIRTDREAVVTAPAHGNTSHRGGSQACWQSVMQYKLKYCDTVKWPLDIGGEIRRFDDMTVSKDWFKFRKTENNYMKPSGLITTCKCYKRIMCRM